MADCTCNNFPGTLSVMGNLGIGTAGPGERLTVIGTGNLPATNLAYLLSNDFTQGIAIGQDEIRQGGTSPSGNLKISAKGHLILQPVGNVGIGTGTPGERLTVIGTNPSPAANIAHFITQELTEGIGVGYNTIRRTGSTANGDLSVTAKGTGKLYLQPNAGGPTPGGVVIGPGSPLNGLLLEVQGNSILRGSLVAGAGEANTTPGGNGTAMVRLVNTNIGLNTLTEIQFGTSPTQIYATISGQLKNAGSNPATDQPAGDLVFSTRATPNGPLVERLRIQADGKIFVGGRKLADGGGAYYS